MYRLLVIIVSTGKMRKFNNKYKQKLTNSFRTRDMFVEVVRWYKSINAAKAELINEDECLYWLSEKQDPADPRIVLREKFLEYRDYTGYKLANTYLGGWRHLQKLMKSPWFKKEFDSWQEELFILLQSESLEKIKEIAETEGATALSAAKYIANKEWERPEVKRGRPSKEEVNGKLSEDARKAKTVQNDYNRIMELTVIEGGRSNVRG